MKFDHICLLYSHSWSCRVTQKCPLMESEMGCKCNFMLSLTLSAQLSWGQSLGLYNHFPALSASTENSVEPLVDLSEELRSDTELLGMFSNTRQTEESGRPLWVSLNMRNSSTCLLFRRALSVGSSSLVLLLSLSGNIHFMRYKHS